MHSIRSVACKSQFRRNKDLSLLDSVGSIRDPSQVSSVHEIVPILHPPPFSPTAEGFAPSNAIRYTTGNKLVMQYIHIFAFSENNSTGLQHSLQIISDTLNWKQHLVSLFFTQFCLTATKEQYETMRPKAEIYEVLMKPICCRLGYP